MRKFFLKLFLACLVFIALVLTVAIIASFIFVKRTTDAINKRLIQNFEKIVRIPGGIPPQVRRYSETLYLWEMETLQNEVIDVKFRFDPAFNHGQKQIEAVLEMSSNGDSSIFAKVLPAVITDAQNRQSVIDLENANLGPNESIGYTQMEISVDKAAKPVKVVWIFPKEHLPEDINFSYAKLSRYPQFLILTLYNLQSIIISLFSSN